MKGFIARMKLRQNRGASYGQLLINIGVITANIRLFVPDADLVVYAVAAVGWVLITTIIGYLDEFEGIWKIEMEYASSAINPFLLKMSEKIDKIYDKVLK